MAGKFGNWGRNRNRARENDASGYDIGVAPVARIRDWALGLMIIASAGALLATSDDHPPDFEFKVSSNQTTTSLSVGKPQAHYLLRARVTALGPEGADSTGSAVATLSGRVWPNDSVIADGASPFVSVSFGPPGEANAPLSALATFTRGSSLSFTGNCAQPEQAQDDPCQGVLELELELLRPSALPTDGSLTITWSVDFEARVPKPSGKGLFESVAAPWTIELVEQ